MQIVKLNKNPLIKYIKTRVNDKNKNFIGVFTGGTGSGKSYSSLKFAEDLDKTFNINRVCFTASNFMRLIKSLLHRSKEGENITGYVVVWDEVGVAHNSRQWATLSNKMVNYVLQSFRKMNIVLLMTCPDFNFLDSNTRKLMHAVFETQYINEKEKKVILKPLLIQNNQRTGKLYYKYPKVRNGRIRSRMSRTAFGLPEKKLIDQYEEKKDKFMQNLYDNITDKLEEEEGIKKKPLTDKQQLILDLLEKKLDINQICEETGLGQGTIYSHIRLIKKKGYKLKPVRQEKAPYKIKYYNIL